MAAADIHTAAVEAVAAQRIRVRARIDEASRADSGGELRAETGAQTGSAGPGPRLTLALDPEGAVLSSYLEPSDVLIDVGGGSRRLGLPLARHCREVVNVEPSADARAAFAAAAAAGMVSNVRAVAHDWLAAPSQIQGDVVLSTHVTYAVPDIEPFVDRLQTASRRRVLVLLYAVPAEAQPIYQQVHQLLFQEAAEIPPSYRQLLPVLWEVGLLPEVRIIDELGVRRQAPTIEAAITGTLQSLSTIIGAPGLERDLWARRVLGDHANELYRPVEGGGYRPASDGDHRGVLITWKPSSNRTGPETSEAR